MKRSFSILLMVSIIIGIAAAFMRPAVPHQERAVETQNKPVKAAFVDAGLDNIEIENDEAINAARKCGFCIGVSWLVDLVFIYCIVTPFEYQP